MTQLDELMAQTLDAVADLQIALIKAEGRAADNEWARDCLKDLVDLRGELEAIGGGPGYAQRSEKAWANAREVFEP